ncbi:uncharacterized protein [Argopecten irradians]|uniref:uncharacterized protein n=1 Tax=Argopecten irradians TaxID=31199 RepID=UPI003714812B
MYYVRCRERERKQMAGQVEPIRSTRQTNCMYHRGNILDWYCKKCDTIICAMCASDTHNGDGHSNILLKLATPENKSKIKAFVDESEEIGSDDVQIEIDSTQSDTRKHLELIKSLEIEVKEQGRKMKEDVDGLVDQKLSQLRLLAEENTLILTKYTHEREIKLEERKQRIAAFKETLQTGTDIQVFDTLTEINTNMTLPETPILRIANFFPNQNRKENLEQAFGKLDISQQGRLQSEETQNSDDPEAGQKYIVGEHHRASEQSTVKDTSRSQQTMFKDTISPSEQTMVKDTISPSEQTMVKDTISPSEQTMVKDTISPSEQTIVKETISPSEQPMVKDTISPSEQTMVKDTISPSEQPMVKDTFSPSEQTMVKDAISPSEQMVVKDIVSPSEQTVVKKISPSEQTVVKKISPSEQTSEKEGSSSSQVALEKIFPSARASASVVGLPRQTRKPTLSPHVTVLSEWIVQRRIITCICSTSDGDIYISDRFNNYIINLTDDKEILASVGVSDMCTSPTTNNLWICSSEDNSIIERKSNSLEHRFNTKDAPRCLCVKRDGHVLVGMKYRIEEYTQYGKYIGETKTSWIWKSLVRSPVKIYQSSISDDVAVLDLDESSDGGKGEALVIVLDTNLQESHRYGQQEHKSQSKSVGFAPVDLTYDVMGHIVVADCQHKCLHVLSGNGQYLKQFSIDSDVPHAVHADREGVLWVGFGGFTFLPNKLKRIQHISV